MIETEQATKGTQERYINILVSRKSVEWVAYNHEFSAHAKVQLIRRGSGSTLDIKGSILNSPLSWKLESGCVAIALDLYRYAVVSMPDMGSGQLAKIVTLIDLEPSKMNVVDKMLISYRDACRPRQGYRTV